jgi:hypothetical protein
MDYYPSCIRACDEYVFIPELRMIIIRREDYLSLVMLAKSSMSVVHYQGHAPESLRKWYLDDVRPRPRMLEHILFTFDCSEQLLKVRSRVRVAGPFPLNMIWHCERDRVCVNIRHAADTKSRMMLFCSNQTLVHDLNIAIACMCYLVVCLESCIFDGTREPITPYVDHTDYSQCYPNRRDHLLRSDPAPVTKHRLTTRDHHHIVPRVSHRRVNIPRTHSTRHRKRK